MSDKDHESLLCRLLTRKQLLEIVPFSYPTIWELMRRGEFPRAIKISSRVFWRADEIQAFVESRPRQVLKGDAEQRQDAAAITTSGEGTHNE